MLGPCQPKGGGGRFSPPSGRGRNSRGGWPPWSRTLQQEIEGGKEKRFRAGLLERESSNKFAMVNNILQ